MEDKDLMEDILLTAKGACDLYLHGTIESATPKVHGAFDQALKGTLQMQNQVYSKMSQKGWYPTQQAQQQQIQQVAQQYAGQ
ncbi:MAG: spore coat protein [Peptococcaceae bacterium]|nr:spore coat protein [Peptococcaceae bacterium]